MWFAPAAAAGLWMVADGIVLMLVLWAGVAGLAAIGLARRRPSGPGRIMRFDDERPRGRIEL